MSRHTIFSDDKFELTLGYQFSNQTLYVQLLHEDEGSEEALEDIDFECELLKNDKKNDYFQLSFSAMVYQIGTTFKEYFTVQDLENWAGVDKTHLYDHLLKERTDRDLCNQVYIWKMVGSKRNHVLRKVVKESV